MAQLKTSFTIEADAKQAAAELNKIVDATKAAFSQIKKGPGKTDTSGLDELKAKAKQVFDETRTAQERFQSKFSELGTLLSKGAIDWDTYGRAVKKARGDMDTAEKGVDTLKGSMSSLAGSLAAVVSVAAIGSFAKSSIDEFAKVESGFRGLEAVANASGVGIGNAMQAAEKLSADGLLSVQEAGQGLQNLLSRGYDLPQAVQTLTRLKDSATFNRAAHLSLGEAVVSATDGLRNENSVLVDNAGVTKNVSVIWKEYADSIGVSVDDLTRQQKIQAEVNGILLETESQAGNAAKAVDGLQGAMARNEIAVKNLKAQIGESLVPVFKDLLEAGKLLIDYVFKPLIIRAQTTGVSIGMLAANFRSFMDLVTGKIGTDDFFSQLAAHAELSRSEIADITKRIEGDKTTLTEGVKPGDGEDQAKKDKVKAKNALGGKPKEPPKPPVDYGPVGPPQRQGADPNESIVQSLENEADALGKTTEQAKLYKLELGHASDALGKTTEQAKLYKLELGHASDAQIARATAASAAIQSDKDFEAAVKASEAAVKDENAAYQDWINTIKGEGASVFAATRTDQENMALEMERLSHLLAQGAIDWDTYGRAALAAVDGINKTVPVAKKKISELEQGVTSGLADSFDKLLSQTTTLRGAFESFGNSVVATLQRIASQKLAESLLSGFFSPSASPVKVGALHSGGIAGGTPTFRKSISPFVFAGAPRYHTGGIAGLSSGEVPAILKKGEGVFTQEQMAALGGGGGGGTVVNVIDQRQSGSPPAEVSSSQGPDGKKQISVLIRDEVRRQIGSGEHDRVMQSNFGIRRPGVVR